MKEKLLIMMIEALQKASYYGYIDIIKTMLEIGANDFNEAIY